MRDKIVLLGAEAPSGREVAKRLRGERYFCKLMRSDATMESIRALNPSGIVLAGEDTEGASAPNPEILSLGIPVLAFGYPARALLEGIGHRGEEALSRSVLSVYYRDAKVFDGVESGERWIEKADTFDVPQPYRIIADGDGIPVAYGWDEASIFLLQFQIERNDLDGTTMLRTFAGDICGCTQWWTPENIIDAQVQDIAGMAGDRKSICAMSGGLDSTVAALLARRALGDQVSCIFVDTGLLREGEGDETERILSHDLGLTLQRVDASGSILWSLAGLKDQSAKWRVVEGEITAALIAAVEDSRSQYAFIKGTNYLDTFASPPPADADLDCPVITPLAELFKGEIRQIGEILGVSPAILNRQPFPGMGLAARIRGEVTAERLHILRRADRLFADEIAASGQEKRVDRYFAMMDDVEGRGIIVLRAVQGMEPLMTVARLPYDLIERTVAQIQQELPAVRTVVYDVTPGLAEWPA